MKKLFLILILILVIGCSKQEPAAEKADIIEEAEIISANIAIDVMEQSLHRFIVGMRPEGVYISYKIKIINIGEEPVDISKEEIKLVDEEGNEYFIEKSASAYMSDRFKDMTIHPGNDVSARLVFDIPDSDKKFTLIVKGKELSI